MLRMSKLTDYGTVILTYLAGDPERVHSAKEVAEQTHLAAPTVSKLLKSLSHAGLVRATRGAGGGYLLTRPPGDISAAEIIDALEGPVAITECSATHSQCELEHLCCARGAWQKINHAIRVALDGVSLAQLQAPGELALNMPSRQQELTH